MTTTTANTVSGQRAVSFAGWLTGSIQRLADLARHLTRPSSNEPRTAEELLALAESVQATQPSWAADLRAVAMHMEAEQGGPRR